MSNTNKDTILQQTIIEELGLQDLPQERQEELLGKVGEVVMKRIYLETMEKLEKDNQEKLIDIMEKNPDKVEVFLAEKIPDYEEFVKKIVDDFRKEMKEDMGIGATSAAN
jgi:hypothetical protein